MSWLSDAESPQPPGPRPSHYDGDRAVWQYPNVASESAATVAAKGCATLCGAWSSPGLYRFDSIVLTVFVQCTQLLQLLI
jgi:hypothetical protein